MSDPSNRLAERAFGKFVAVAVLLLGLAISGFVWHAESTRARGEAAARLNEQANAFAARIAQRLVAYEVILRAAASLFAATENPTRAQWGAFVEAFALDTTYPGVQGVAFAARVRAPDVAGFEQAVRAEGFPEFRVWPSGPRAEVSPINYIEPMSAANVRALGYDMGSDPDRRQAMNASRDTGKPTLSPSVVLLQDAGGARRVGALMFLAVYGYGGPALEQTMWARQQAHRGWVYVAFRPAQMIESLDRSERLSLRVRLYDGAAPDAGSLLYQDPRLGDTTISPDRAARMTIQAVDRTWTLEAFPGPPASGAAPFSSRSPWTLLVGGVLVSLLLFGVLWSMATTRDRAHALAREMTLALRRANEELDTRVRQRTADLSAINAQLREEAVERQRVEGERAAALQRERERAAQLRALADAGLGIGDLREGTAPLDYLADRAYRIVGCRHAFLVRTGEGAGSLASVASSMPIGFEDRRALLEASARWPTRDRIEVVRVVSEDSDIPRDAWPQGCVEAMIVPIRVGTEAPLATMYLQNGDERRFTLEDEVIIHQLVLLVTGAMATAEAVSRERRARMEAEAANNSKDEFLAIVSHELRTPLHAILGWLQVLERQGSSSEHMGRALDVIRRNAEAQSTLIDDLLDLARIEQGKLALELERVRFDALLVETVESLRQGAAAKRVALDLRIEAHAQVQGDPVRLQQVVANLVSNAVKFSESPGRVEVRLREDSGQLMLEVEDEGEGIEPDVLPHIFERFTQGDPASRRRKGGLGLGLALVKNIVEAHGGRVSAASGGKGHGAVFTVCLPIVARGETTTGSASGQAAAGAGVGTVLLVEDDDDARDALVNFVAEEAAVAASFASATEALAWLETHADREWPGLVVCDIEMPQMDGYAFLDELRALEARRGRSLHVSVVALTAHASGEDRARVLACGFAAHVPKPVSAEHLRRVLHRLLRAPGAQADTRASESASMDGPRYRS